MKIIREVKFTLEVDAWELGTIVQALEIATSTDYKVPPIPDANHNAARQLFLDVYKELHDG